MTNLKRLNAFSNDVPPMSLKDKKIVGYWFIQSAHSAWFPEISNPLNNRSLSCEISKKFASILIPKVFPKRRGRVIKVTCAGVFSKRVDISPLLSM